MTTEKPPFNRKKNVDIRTADRSIIVTAHMVDNYHEMEAELRISMPDMVIRSVVGRMIKVPDERCREAGAVLEKAVGLEIKRGLTQLMEQTIGGRNGCSHMTNLVMEACHASVQGIYLSLRGEFGDILDEMTIAERVKSFMLMRPQMIDSCVSYRSTSPLIVEAQSSPMTDRVKNLLFRVSELARKPKG
jgi:hypothetical protein